MMPRSTWNNRLKAVALGVGIGTERARRSAIGTGRSWLAIHRAKIAAPIFLVYMPAVKLVWQSPSKLYAYGDQIAIQKAIDDRIGDSILPFAYPPFTAVVLMPLGWLPFRASFAAMTLANAMLLALTLKFADSTTRFGKKIKRHGCC